MLLNKISLFADLPDSDLEAVTKLAVTRNFSKNTLVLCGGEQSVSLRDIASMVGASREMVSRILRDLSIGGYITIKNKIFTINERLPSGW